MNDDQITDSAVDAERDMTQFGRIIGFIAASSAVALAFAIGAHVSHDVTARAYIKSLNNTIPSQD